MKHYAQGEVMIDELRPHDPNAKEAETRYSADEIRSMFGWNMTDDEVETKRKELDNFLDVLVDVVWESVIERKKE